MKKINFMMFVIALLSIGLLEPVSQAEGLKAQDTFPVIGPIARNANGTAKSITYSAAVKYCKKLGKSIPTAKQFALALNPKGIMNHGTVWDEIRPTDGHNFYYNSRTYEPSPEDEDYEWAWTSSTHELDVNEPYRFYATNGQIGSPTRPSQTPLASVKCLISP